MHCVFHAYGAHLVYLGVTRVDWDWEYYKWFMELTHGEVDCPTWGGIIPCLIDYLAYGRGLVVSAQHRAFGSKEYYKSDEMSRYAHDIRRRPDWGLLVETITLKPAIYLLLADGHATFSETVPVKGVPVMALQLQKKESQDERDVNDDSTDPGSL